MSLAKLKFYVQGGMMSSHEFEVLNLSKNYGNQAALENVNLSIEKGSMNFLLGANGSGKSTLMKCIAGHQYWDSGEILHRGQSRKIDRKDFNAGIHLISEDISPPLVSLGQLKSLYQTIYPHWDEEVFQQFLSWGDLNLSKKLTAVSRGQRIQGLLGLALATKPQILLIDEATAVLDPFIRNRFILEIERLNQSLGMTTIIATNIGSEIAVLKGRLLIMQKGRVVVDRPAEKIADEFVKIRVSAEDLNAAIAAGFSFIERNQDDSFSFLGLKESLSKLSVGYQTDKRSIAVDEVFIFFSDRKSV